MIESLKAIRGYYRYLIRGGVGDFELFAKLVSEMGVEMADKMNKLEEEIKTRQPGYILPVDTDTMNWKLFNAISQMSHWLGGAFAVLAGYTLFGLKGMWLSVGAVFIGAAVKEFWFDYKYESTEVRGSSLEDFLFYILGLVIGAGIIAHNLLTTCSHK